VKDFQNRSEETSQLAMIKRFKPKNKDNLNNVRHEARKHFRNKKREHLKEFATHSKNTRDSYREIKEYKNGHQPITNIAVDENRIHSNFK
jgi:hypothetical protein